MGNGFPKTSPYVKLTYTYSFYCFIERNFAHSKLVSFANMKESSRSLFKERNFFLILLFLTLTLNVIEGNSIKNSNTNELQQGRPKDKVIANSKSDKPSKIILVKKKPAPQPKNIVKKSIANSVQKPLQKLEKLVNQNQTTNVTTTQIPKIVIKKVLELKDVHMKKVTNPIKPTAKQQKYLEYVWAQNRANSSSFFTSLPKKQPLLSESYESLFNGSVEDRCPEQGAGIKLVIVVNSAPKNREHRLNIRKTYGFYKFFPEVRILFFIGKDGAQTTEQDLANENRLFNDIIRVNLRENYFKLTIKTVAILEFAMKKCGNANYLLKCDDDVYLNVPGILKFIEDHEQDERKIYGLIYRNKEVPRDPSQKFYLGNDEYTSTNFPDFIVSPFYFMKMNLVPELFYTALRTPFFRLDDVFLTGFVAPQLGIKLVYLRGIFDNYKKFKVVSEIDYLICYFLVDKLDQMYSLWTFSSEYIKTENVI